MSGKKAVCVAFVYLSLLARPDSAPAFEARAVRRGDGFPVYLAPPALAAANEPLADLAGGSGFWSPGPERFYGWALRDLRDYLGQMTKAKFPLTALTALDAKADSGIFVGTFGQFPSFKPLQAGSRLAVASADPEAFAVEVQGDKLFVLGKTDLGAMAAVYTLLDRVGCKWFAPGKHWENVPELDGLILDAKLNAASAGPSYRSRCFFPSWGPNTSVVRKGQRERDYALWNLRNRMGGSAYTANFHNDPGMVPPALFGKRPELFALVNGKRNPYALSRANPETVALAVESAVKYLKENRGKGSYYDSFSVETNDGSPACEWSLKRIAEDKAGKATATDLNYWFANRVAEGIEKAGLKDRWVGMCSYADHAGVPSFDLHPRVAVQVTTGLDFSSGMTVEQRLDGLRRRKATRVGLYHYLNLLTWSLDRPGGHPAADPLGVAADLKRWHRHGASTYMAETSDSWVNGGPGHYLAGRVLWDVESDPARELDAYYEGAFGPAAGEVRALHEDWARSQGKLLPKITRGDAARWHRLIADADRLAGDNAHLKARLNDVKRYYLYLNYLRELDIDLVHPRVPSREERLLRMVRYLGSNRGEGAFHAIGLVPTWLVYMPPSGVKIDLAKMGPEFVALAANITDEKAWKAFPPISAAEVDKRFASVRLPSDGYATGRAVLDPAVKVFPADARAPKEIDFPKLHGPPTASGPRHYTFRVTAPTPKLTFHVSAGNPLGGGTKKRTCTVTADGGEEMKQFAFGVDAPASFELADVKPGVYTAVFPEFGAEKVTVRGGNTFGAVRAFDADWGFSPFRPAGLKAGEDYKAYFLVPAGASSLEVRLDATHALVDEGPRHFLAELVATVRASAAGRGLVFIAEDHRNLRHMLLPAGEGGWGLDGVWADDFHHQLRRRLAGDAEGYYADFTGSTADIVRTLDQGWFFTGQRSAYLKEPRGTDPAGLPPARFVVCLQNHDQVGNRAFGERLHHQISPEAYRAATALLLLAPQTPMLFMGQEWAATTPFLYFTDHEEELGRAVTRGRRNEFRHFSAFVDPAAVERIPDPQAPETFESSKLRWPELAEQPHQGLWQLYQALLALRRRELASGPPTGGARAVALTGDTLAVVYADTRAAVLLVVVHFGKGETVIVPNAALGADAGVRWAVELTTEEPRFTVEGPGLEWAACPEGLAVTFARPSALVARLQK